VHPPDHLAAQQPGGPVSSDELNISGSPFRLLLMGTFVLRQSNYTPGASQRQG